MPWKKTYTQRQFQCGFELRKTSACSTNNAIVCGQLVVFGFVLMRCGTWAARQIGQAQSVRIVVEGYCGARCECYSVEVKPHPWPMKSWCDVV